MNYKQYTYTININPTEYRGVLHTTLTLPVDVDFIIEKKLDAMNNNFVDAKKVLDEIKNEKNNR